MPPCMWPAGWKQTFSGPRGSLALKLSASLIDHSGEIGGKKIKHSDFKKKIKSNSQKPTQAYTEFMLSKRVK